jgi:hypothetical protein
MRDRLHDLSRFYQIVDQIELRHRGTRQLIESHGRMSWPGRGVYFFFEAGETRSDDDAKSRVVRVGTHALKPSSATSLWRRLSRHKGTHSNGGGNHRGSIFRLLIGDAMMRRSPENVCPTWGQGASAPADVRASEQQLERLVSAYIGSMPFLCLSVEDEPGPDSLRGFIERNAIGLLSNYHRIHLDPTSSGWLGRLSSREQVRASGLWNNHHVDKQHDPKFLDVMEHLMRKIG